MFYLVPRKTANVTFHDVAEHNSEELKISERECITYNSGTKAFNDAKV